MNNYCTKCGKKIKKDEIECKKCGTPIVDIKEEMAIKSKNMVVHYIIIIIGIIILSFIFYYLTKTIIQKKKIQKLENEYVEPFLKQNLKNYSNYTIQYSRTGKCIVSGNCHLDPVNSLLGECEENKYLSEKECKAFYYSIYNDEEHFMITVFNRDDKYNVVKGENVLYNENFNNSLINNYVKPYLDKKYTDYEVEFESMGKCVISGECYSSAISSCDSTCEGYRYLDEGECKSYYYSVKTTEEKIGITVFNKDGKYSVVEGLDINGNN